MKIAIISDIHGNLEALSALTESYDELWVLGDLVNYGPDPGAVVDFVRSQATVVVRGNHDDAVGFNRDPRCSAPYRAMAQETMEFTLSALSPEQRAYLAGLPLVVNRTVDDTEFVLCHAAPSGPLYKYVPANSPEWEREMEEIDADLLLVGHTHTPFVQTVGASLVVNPGSLGQPKTGSTKASYAIWDRGVVLRSIDYEMDLTLRKIDLMPVSKEVKEDLKAVLRSGGFATASQSLVQKGHDRKTL
jgi:protein phosphatase